MFNQQNRAGGQSSDLLSLFDSIHVRNEEKIPAEDRQFCEKLQGELHRALDRLTGEYNYFKNKADEYEGIYAFSFEEDGTVYVSNELSPKNCEDRYFIRSEFKPFKAINEIVDSQKCIIRSFENQIIAYFNQKYHVHIDQPEREEKIVWGFKPTYQYLVDIVLGYLGGRNFRETAEYELLQRFHKVAARWAKHRDLYPLLKGEKIVFPRVISFDEFYSDQYHIHYNSKNDVDLFCSGIAFCDDTFHGSSRMIIGFDSNNVDLSKWYDLTTDKATKMKFFKNGRIDVQFKDKTTSKDCFLKLKLDQYLPENIKE